MRNDAIRPGGLNTLRLVQLLVGLSLVFVAVLASAPLRPYFGEWRSVQKEYNRLAVNAGMVPVVVGVKQIWRPALGVTDRCTTCHLGMSGGSAIGGHALFGPHPPLPHDPREFGCTVCHGGQGRATAKDDAHGFVSHWDEQILEPGHVTVGCGTCHDRFPTESRAVLDGGLARLEQLDCLSCHRVDGRGRGNGPDLSYVGLAGFSEGWDAEHLATHQAGTLGTGTSSFGPVAPSDTQLINRFLGTRVGAPFAVRAQAVALERGCLGCHKLGGVGGDEGPALDTVGRKPVGDLDFRHVPGPRTLTNYMRAHLLDPARVFPGSTMLEQDYTAEDVDLLTGWILSLRSRNVPAAFLPKDRLRRQVLGEPRSPQTAEETFAAFCSACHGARGEGRTNGRSEARFPAIGSGDFLGVATDDFIARTLASGRPNRRMPSLAAPGGPLDTAAVRAVVTWLRGRLRPPPSQAELSVLAVDAALGARTYREDCATCHGEAGEGTPLGSPLGATDRRLTQARAYEATVQGIREAAMPAYADRPPAALAAVLYFVRRLPPTPSSRATWTLGRGDASTGEQLYSRSCAGCHGNSGQGKVGPALANPGFQQAATPAYIAATIVRGRAGTPMPAFGRDSAGYARLSASEVLDLTAFIRERLGKTPPAQGAD